MMYHRRQEVLLKERDRGKGGRREGRKGGREEGREEMEQD